MTLCTSLSENLSGKLMTFLGFDFIRPRTGGFRRIHMSLPAPPPPQKKKKKKKTFFQCKTLTQAHPLFSKRVSATTTHSEATRHINTYRCDMSRPYTTPIGLYGVISINYEQRPLIHVMELHTYGCCDMSRSPFQSHFCYIYLSSQYTFFPDLHAETFHFLR